MSAQIIPARWLFTAAVTVTLVEIGEDESHWTYLIAKRSGPGAYVVNLDDSGNVLVNGLEVKLTDEELIELYDRIDTVFLGNPNMAQEIGRPHAVAPSRSTRTWN